MADDKTRSSGEPDVSDALTEGQQALDEALSSAQGSLADDVGYIPADAAGDAPAAGAAGDEASDALDLPGEELARDLPDPEPYVVADEEAEELDVDESEAPEPDDADEDPHDDADLDDLLEPVEPGPVTIEVPEPADDEPADAEGPEVDDPEQLAEAEEVARAARSTRPVKKKRAAEAADDEPAATAGARPVRKKKPAAEAAAPTRKSARTPKRREAAGGGRRRRTTPAQFVRESVAELRKVVWPTGSQVRQYFVVVLAFVLFVITFVGLLDFGLGWLLLKALG